MLAAVVIVVAAIGLLIMATLVSRAQQLWLLKEMRVRARRLVTVCKQYIAPCVAAIAICLSHGPSELKPQGRMYIS
jgi:hypothetical protein